ncbi:MAG: hypothetical protein WC819_01425 [Parcubacteria group bacterium]|jgi:hypothetical protein
MKKKYGAWEVDECYASLGNVTIPIKLSDDGIFGEGVHGNFTIAHRHAVAGVCLWDTTWGVVFTTGGVRSIALPLDRERVEDRIRTRGFEVSAVIFPTELTAYHRKLITFVADTVAQTQPEKLLFHIPHHEYLVYICNLEALIGKNIVGAEQILADLVEKVKAYFFQEMKRVDFDRYEFISPMNVGAITTEESYLFPYLYPEKFGATASSLFAIEDLVEVKITMLAEQMRGHKIPVRFCVMDVPHPYMTFSKKGVGHRKDVVTVSLS